MPQIVLLKKIINIRNEQNKNFNAIHVELNIKENNSRFPRLSTIKLLRFYRILSFLKNMLYFLIAKLKKVTFINKSRSIWIPKTCFWHLASITFSIHSSMLNFLCLMGYDVVLHHNKCLSSLSFHPLFNYFFHKTLSA